MPILWIARTCLSVCAVVDVSLLNQRKRRYNNQLSEIERCPSETLDEVAFHTESLAKSQRSAILSVFPQ